MDLWFTGKQKESSGKELEEELSDLL